MQLTMIVSLILATTGSIGLIYDQQGKVRTSSDAVEQNREHMRKINFLVVVALLPAAIVFLGIFVSTYMSTTSQMSKALIYVLAIAGQVGLCTLLAQLWWRADVKAVRAENTAKSIRAASRWRTPEQQL